MLPAMSGIFDPPSPAILSQRLQSRVHARLVHLDDDAVAALLADAIYQERRRMAANRGRWTEQDRAEAALIDEVAPATGQGRSAQEAAIHTLVDRYTQEIHNRFSDRTYRFATKVLPGALTRLLTAAEPRELFGADFDPTSRIQIGGPVALINKLARTHTLLLTPTHVSNLDSPLLGYALFAGGLPPFLYGAGLNLFDNPVMAAFMSRLGAYTVDRRKKHEIYKETLKDYSIEALTRRCHSLFFPGGTRARNGMVEKRVKKGLLGTGLAAWQEGLAAGRPDSEILVVPCTLSIALVLEAETLIEDALAEEGKSRYIITDDEFSEPRTIATFARRVLNLDASVHVRFGRPLDVLGNPVDDEGQTLDPSGAVVDRRRYITNAAGQVVSDAQRDQAYTARLAEKLVGAWHRDNTVLDTHVAAFAAWGLLKRRFPRLDMWKLCLLQPRETALPRGELLSAMERVRQGVLDRVAAGTLHHALGPGDAEALCDRAIGTFASFHRRQALSHGLPGTLHVDPRLALYYGNRLTGYGLESVLAPGGSP
jgi:glycerol-3-phosphate O-acyltransferase